MSLQCIRHGAGCTRIAAAVVRGPHRLPFSLFSTSSFSSPSFRCSSSFLLLSAHPLPSLVLLPFLPAAVPSFSPSLKEKRLSVTIFAQSQQTFFFVHWRR